MIPRLLALVAWLELGAAFRAVRGPIALARSSGRAAAPAPGIGEPLPGLHGADGADADAPIYLDYLSLIHI